MNPSLTCKVKNHLGEPTLFINDEPTVPFMFYGYAAQIGVDFNFINQAKLAKDAGVHIYTIPVEFVWKTEGVKPVYSTLHNIVDSNNPYASLNKIIRNIIQFDSEALILPRFYLHPPLWWIKENPDETMIFSDGKSGRVSIASEKWKVYVERSLIAFVNHCEEKFGNHIIGYHPALLTTDEFFYDRAWEPVFYGFEEPLRNGFVKWLHGKYKTPKSLQHAWGNSEINFENITLPTVEQREKSGTGFFRDPVKDKFVIDFYEYKNSLVANTIEFFAKIIKNETNKNKIFVAFYGYSFELSAIPMGIQSSGHLKLEQIIKSPYVDAICSPISYFNRGEGGIGAFMAPVDSIRKAGKLWINEDDTRTHLCKVSGQEPFGVLKNLSETLSVHRRNFARIMPRRIGTWYMDLLNRGWLDSKKIWEQIAELKKIYQKKLSVKSSFSPDVAVIVDERSPLFLECNNKLTRPLYYSFRSQFYRMGSSFNLYLLSDVLEGKIKLPKVNIFLGAWYLENNEREKLISILQKKTAIWFYGAGLLDKTGASKNNMSKLTGFSFKELHNKTPRIKFLENKKWNDKLKNKFFAPVVDGSFNDKNIFQTIEKEIRENYEKIWAVDNENVTPLAVYDDDNIALAVTNKLGYNSIYCGIPGLPAQFLRNVIKNSGAHLYLNSNEIMETDDNILAVGAYDKKVESINLDSNKYLFNFFENKKLLPKNNVVKDEFQAGETKLYWILNANKKNMLNTK
ncbi:MAG: hypothetical protein DRI44_09765 [Chlamydiae bacterium]|nr:MAG: hypothetical protein DRI44_09765 [Chlamydiota bacterium]